MTVELFDFGDGVPSRRAFSDIENDTKNDVAPAKLSGPDSANEQPELSPATHTSVAEKPRTAIRGFSLVLAVVGHALIGSLIAAGGHLILGAVASVAVMSCSAALVATEALANQ